MSGGTSTSDVLIKQEPRCEEQDDEAAVRVKEEPEHDATGPTLEPCSPGVCGQLVKEEDLHLMYEGHVMKEEELAIGPEVWHQPTLPACGGHVVKEEMPIVPEVLQQLISVNTKGLQEPLHQIQQSNCSRKLSSCGIVHSGEKLFACGICNKQFTETRSLSKHLLIHSVEKPLVCNICNKEFLRKVDLTQHLCNKKYWKDSLTEEEDREKKLTCDVCNKKFSQRCHLTRHLFTHRGVKKFTCDVCDKKFSHKGNLTIHQRVHTGEKKFTCDVCDKKFSLMCTLTNHLFVHSGEKKFTCDVCNKKFALKGHLNRHLRVHSGEKKFTCDICHKAFSERYHLTRHIRSVHKGR